MRNYSYIYESAQIENFERQILSGHLTEAKLIEMYENNQLSEQQIQIAQEAFGGLKGLMGAAKSGLGKAATGIANTAKGAYNTAAAGAKQFGQNVSDIRQSGIQSDQANQRIAALDKQMKVLENLLAQHIAASPYSQLKGINIKDITLGQIENDLRMKAATASGEAQANQQRGFFGGVGSAMAGARRPQSYGP